MNRRGFLKSCLGGAAAAVAAPLTLFAAEPERMIRLQLKDSRLETDDIRQWLEEVEAQVNAQPLWGLGESLQFDGLACRYKTLWRGNENG